MHPPHPEAPKPHSWGPVIGTLRLQKNTHQRFTNILYLCQYREQRGAPELASIVPPDCRLIVPVFHAKDLPKRMEWTQGTSSRFMLHSIARRSDADAINSNASIFLQHLYVTHSPTDAMLKVPHVLLVSEDLMDLGQALETFIQ